jgi:5-amino-6-(5-phosphoribosylamino)uracil reductase
MRPHITLKAAISLDGFLDDTSPNRLILSSPEDLAEVDRLRASCDAILIGAQTLREDNPRLSVKNEGLREQRVREGKTSNPKAIVLSAGGDIDPASNIFQQTSPILCLPESARAGLEAEVLSSSQPLYFSGNRVCLSEMLESLCQHGIQNLLVEGGNAVLSQFFSEGLYDSFRLSVASFALANKGGTKLSLQSQEIGNLESLEVLGSNVIHHYSSRS